MKNAAFKAAISLTKFSDDRGIDIEMKNIPHRWRVWPAAARTLGVLLALNDLYKTNLSETLIKLASRVGADVPFCLKGGLMLALMQGLILASQGSRIPSSNAKPMKVSTAELTAPLTKGWIRHPNRACPQALVDGDAREFFSYSMFRQS